MAPAALAQPSEEEARYQKFLTAPKATEEEMKKILFEAEIPANTSPATVTFQIYNGLADRVICGLVLTITWTDAGSAEEKSMDIFPRMNDVLPLTVDRFYQNVFRGEEIASVKHEITLKEVQLRKLDGGGEVISAAAAAGESNVTPGPKTACQKVEDTYRVSKDVDLATAQFTEWQTLPDSQVNWDEMPKGSYKAYLEGRNNKGLDEYRSVIRTLDTTKYESSDLRSQMTSDEFFERGMRLKREGWERMCLQVFIDGSGTARYQAVWLKPRTNGKPGAPASSRPADDSGGGGRE